MKEDAKKKKQSQPNDLKKSKNKPKGQDETEDTITKIKRLDRKRKYESSSSSTSSSSSYTSSSSDSSSSESSSSEDKKKKKKLTKFRKVMKKAKRKDSSSTSSSSSSEEMKRRNSRKKRVMCKRIKKKKCTSPSSSSTSSSTTSSEEISPKKSNSKKHGKENKAKSKAEDTFNIPIDLMEKSKIMAPMTKQEWEKKQSTVRRVYDESTGRQRLIKGDGEVLEEIVSKERHKSINQQATRGDGDYFQSKLKEKIKK